MAMVAGLEQLSLQLLFLLQFYYLHLACSSVLHLSVFWHLATVGGSA